MSELGNLLRGRREELNKNIQEVSQDTKIREASIKIMERGAFHEMPSYLHSYGFVKQYAEYLGYDYQYQIKPIFDIECPKIRSNNSEVESPIVEDVLFVEKDSGSNSSKKNIITVAIVLVLLLLASGTYYIYHSMQNRLTAMRFNAIDTYEENINKPITEVDMLLDEVNNINIIDNTKLNDGIDNDSADINSLISNQQIDDQENVNIDKTIPKRLIVAFSDDCWIKYQADDLPAIEYSGTIGQSKALTFIDNFSLDIGNAAGLSFTYGRQQFGNFGSKGLVLRNLRYHIVDGSLVLEIR